MKVNKGVNVNKREIRKNQLNRDYQLYTSRVYNDASRNYYGNARDIGVQYNYKKDNVYCTCKNVLRRNPEVRYFSGLAKHIYTCHASRSFTDVGVGTVKAFQRRKVKRIYLPETDDRGVGSSDLSSFYNRRTRYYRDTTGSSYYDHKRTSSKCVGGFINTTAAVLSEKLSPIIQMKSGGTSPKLSVAFDVKNNIKIGNDTRNDLATVSTQVNDENIKNVNTEIRTVEVNVDYENESLKQDVQGKKYRETAASPCERKEKIISKRAQEAERVFSSDSLVQHVHNLETPSEVHENPLSIDPMENKLEREYRKMFSTKSKDSTDNIIEEYKTESSLKSTSILRKRFEALRRGITKKEDSKRNAIMINESSKVSEISRRDVSIVSDPPSLESRSYSNNKIYTAYSKVASNSKDVYKTYDSSKELGPDYEVTDNDGVKGMFKLWGKKFNLDKDDVANSPKLLAKTSPQSRKEKELKILSRDSIGKKDGKKLFFFNRKSKDKTTKPAYKKKGVTAGRCEVGDGLTIKIGAANPTPRHPEQRQRAMERIPEEYGGMLRKAWLQQFLTRSFESRHSVKIRWNNKAYGTSSSTVFEIMENVYKDSGVVFRSRSDVTTAESSYYKSFNKQKVNFVHDIEAWMIPELIPDKIKTKPLSNNDQDREHNIQVRISNQKWFIDKSKAFAHKIEVVLHSQNVLKCPIDASSEYLTIDIPKGFFSDFSSDSCGPIYTSNEEVYKIVEYESPESQTRFENNINETGDLKDIKVTVSVKGSGNLETKILEKVITTPAVCRDVVIQGSDVCIPKRCNVIGVGIITQNDMNSIRKPISTIQDQYSDEDSDRSTQMLHVKSKFADSFLHDYYRHWIPLDINLSWCVSDSQIEACTENLQATDNNKPDGVRSCPIYDDYQTSVIPSCVILGCSPSCEGDKPSIVTKIYNKFKSRSKSDTVDTGTRVLPKDSVEVCKRRKIYAQSNKGNWQTYDDETYSVPSVECKNTNCSTRKTKKKSCKKHVSIPDCDNVESPMDLPLCQKPPRPPHCHKLSSPLRSCIKKSHTPFSCQPSQPQCPNISPRPQSSPAHSPAQNMSPRMSPCMQPKPQQVQSPCSSPKLPLSPRTPSPCSSTCVVNKVSEKKSPLCNKVGCPNHSGNLTSSPPSVPRTCSSPKKEKPCVPRPRPCSPPKKEPVCVPRPKPCSLPKKESFCVPRPKPCSPPKKEAPCVPRPCSPPKKEAPCVPRPCSSPKKEAPSMPRPCSPPKKEAPCVPRSCSPPKKETPSVPRPCSPPKKEPSCVPRPCSPPKKGVCSSPGKPVCGSPVVSGINLRLSPKSSSCSLSKKTSPKSPPTCATKSSSPRCPASFRNPKRNKSQTCDESCPLRKSLQRNQNTTDSSPKCPGLKITDSEQPSCNACRKINSQEFPWPLKNKHSNQPSATSLCSESPLSPNESRSDQNCDFEKLVCIKKPNDCLSPKCNSPPKLSGLFLKMKPCNKVDVKQQKSCNQKKTKVKASLGMKCSEDKIIIRVKKGTISTEEIREGLDFKVEDEDGVTLFERNDYVYNPTEEKQKMLKNTQVHVVSTSRVDANVGIDKDSVTNLTEVKSDRSVANLIEINLKLKLTQGEKTPEINIGNKEFDTKHQIGQNSQGVFMLKDQTDQCVKDTSDKNDIDIKIIIKNFKQKEVNKVGNEDFAHKIKEKFQTVSTGYSDVKPDNAADVFSIHKATVNLASSNEASKTEVEVKDLSSVECIELDQTELETSQSATDKIHTDKSESKVEIPNTTNSKVEDIHNYIYKEYNNFIENTEIYSSMSDTDDNILNINIATDEPLISNSVDLITKALTRDEKKSLLKKVFEKASKIKRFGNKSKMRPIKDMLNVILTDSSDQGAATSRELINDMKKLSKPNYFRESDSMNNYYKIESSSATCKKSNQNYPSENVSECDDNVSEESFEIDDGKPDCMCSTLAGKLNMCVTGGACCCNKKVNADKETNCDIRNEEDYLLMNYKKIAFADVETQHSRCGNSDNVSVQSRGISGPSLSDCAEVTIEDRQRYDKKQTIYPSSATRKRPDYKYFNKNAMLGITDDDKVFLLNSKPKLTVNKVSITSRRSYEKLTKKVFAKYESPADILQSYETKKAVLEIYAHKTIENNEEKIVARLPKFLYDDDSYLDEGYEDSERSMNKGFRNKVFMMSVRR